MLYSTVVRVRVFSALRRIEEENVFTFLSTINKNEIEPGSDKFPTCAKSLLVLTRFAFRLVFVCASLFVWMFVCDMVVELLVVSSLLMVERKVKTFSASIRRRAEMTHDTSLTTDPWI